MTERLRRMQAIDLAIDAILQTAAFQRVDTELGAASWTAIQSSKALLQQRDLGTRLPGFDFP
jgi:hypothetical protein